MSAHPKVSIVGLGRLGAPVAACYAARGFEVVGYDPLPGRVDAVNERRSLVFEPGVDAVFERAGDRLRATTDLEDAVSSTDVTFLVVPTPSVLDGSFSLEHLLPICEQIGAILSDRSGYHLVVVMSTVMPGATDLRVRPILEKASGKKIGEEIGLCYGAVFVTLGHVIEGFLKPDVVLVGECDDRSGRMLEAICRQVCTNDPPVARMSPFNAELTKLAVNVFVAAKISVANVLARVCEQMPGGDVDVVTSAMQLDRRVGQGALRGAIAYGGPFFSRDNQAFGTLMRRLEIARALGGALGRFNREQTPWLADFVYGRLTDGGRVGLLGLAYKADTDVIVESPSLCLCRHLVDQDIPVTVHDPAAMSAAREVLPPSVEFASSAEACIERADLVVLVTPWEVYRQIPAEVWAREGAPRIVIDCWRIVDSLAGRPGIEYVPLGKGECAPLTH